ncbi:hypothetical protein HID58_018380 [Brassica napus]|uniref:Uncharacterized protein n=1 Tax=Brassica napus TaxID=3708 RepID=A0ABQ8D9T9_BRANA|nr:hypothetical protein HID58_018380 [Brassica napus]
MCLLNLHPWRKYGDGRLGHGKQLVRFSLEYCPLSLCLSLSSLINSDKTMARLVTNSWQKAEAQKSIIWACSWRPFGHQFEPSSRDKTLKIWPFEKDARVKQEKSRVHSIWDGGPSMGGWHMEAITISQLESDTSSLMDTENGSNQTDYFNDQKRRRRRHKEKSRCLTAVEHKRLENQRKVRQQQLWPMKRLAWRTTENS